MRVIAEACREKTAKFTPLSVSVAPSGRALPFSTEKLPKAMRIL
jgi:hypothetical protein